MSGNKNLKTCLAICLILLTLHATAIASGKIIYVDNDATGLNDGSSWQNAYKFLQDALADANSSPKPVEIRVAQGIYRPDETSADPNGTCDRTDTFQLINGVILKGGYAGFGERDPNARDIEMYETILSGDLNGDDIDVSDPCDLLTEPTRAENSYHVVTGSGTDRTAILDGFTISGGKANGPRQNDEDDGGGMYNDSGSPTVANCTFSGNCANYGGGMYTVYSEPTLTNCTFSGNAAECGGAMVNGNSNPMLTNCTFSENTGGGMVNWRSSPTLSNCTFSANSAGYDCGGGAMHNEYSNPMLTNCTFRGNSAEYGGGMYNNETEPTLTNCLFIGNSADYGGGMYSEWCSRPTLTNCTFSGNSAVSGGGGMYNYDVIPTLTNCTFTGNLAANGGGMWNGAAGGLRLINCTFTGNFASSGGGIYNSVSVGYPMEFPLTNCILWGSSDSSGGGESAQIHGGAPVVNYSCIHGWTGNFGGTGNISDDPCFVEPGYWDPNGTPEDANDDFWVDGDYHLKSQAGRWDANEGRWTKDDVTSLCIDAGDPNYPIGLEPFPNGGIINMGAYGGTEEASKSYFDKPVCETIVAGDINGDCIVNLNDLALMSYHWLEEH
jgi:parallel beta-helix repeat protein